MYTMLDFLQVENGHKNEAKAVFYQAINQCPWAKVTLVHRCACINFSIQWQMLYFDAVLYFPEEIEKVIEIAEEKEIRLRAPYQEAKLLWSAANDNPTCTQ